MIYTVIIPALLTFVPWLVVRHVLATPASRHVAYRRAASYLWAAAILWVAAMTLPSVRIGDQTDTFGMHFTGGMVACILFYFSAMAYRWRFSAWWHIPLALYFFVSGLGVLNELFENFLQQTNLMVVPMMSPTDTWWDLTANTLGAATAFLLVCIYRKLIARK